MIALSTSLAPPPAKGATVPLAAPGPGDFSDAMAGLTETPTTDKHTVSPRLSTGPAKPGLPDVSRLADSGTTDAPMTITAFLDAAKADPAAETLPIAKGQDIAGDGKTLPADSDHHDASKDIIWLSSAMLPIPLPVSNPSGWPKFGAPIAPVAVETTPPDLPPNSPIAQPIGATPVAPIAREGDETQPGLTPPDPIAPDEAARKFQPVPPQQDLFDVPAAQKSDLPTRTVSTLPVGPSPAPTTLSQTPVTQPAGQVFAAAIASVVQQARRDEREPGDLRAPLTIAATALEALHSNAIAAMAEAKHSALDLKQDSGLQGMIDHIESLRDGADANDTRIRLVPDALGAVDVSVRKQGDRVHVHFAAENRASAQLLSEAQPRLAELAEQRGVKLGQTSVAAGVDAGLDSNRGQTRQQRAAIHSTRPVAVTGADISDTTDSRIG